MNPILWQATALFGLLLLLSGCATSSADVVFFGVTTPPENQTLRYISGGEPESLDPQVGSGQPEARIYMSLFDGLTEYDPKTMLPIPALAERWDVNDDFTQFVFHLRPNAKWSNGEPITAEDFVYSLRRALTPAFAARNAYLAYYVLNAQGFNEGGYFAKDRQGRYVMDDSGKARAVFAAKDVHPNDAEREFVQIQPEDLGIEALDDHTVRYTLNQSAPFFVGLTAHQFFRIVPRKTIERFGDVEWTQPENIVTCGAFKLKEWIPYDKIVVVRDPMYWDAATVKLDEISFYAIEDTSTMMNLYKAGSVDATYNHTVPPSWLDVIKPMKDFMSTPELGNDYYQMNTTRPPLDDKRVRRAFNMAIDKEGLALYRKTAKPLLTFVPAGVVAGYPKITGDPFDPEQARQLLVEAGYKDSSGQYDASKFPIGDVEITYNTLDTNRQVAEYIQAQWKQNLGLTLPLKNMEFKTFLTTRAALAYKGFARSGWIADYVDPFSFLNIFYTPGGDNGTGWWDPKYVKMLDEANRMHDPHQRFELLAKAEAVLLENEAVIPLMTRSTDWMKKPYVKGMYPNPGTLHAWKFVYIEHDPAKWDYGVPDMTSPEATTP
jgi:ABC-type oligopeptide transport system substrate-binding subunit